MSENFQRGLEHRKLQLSNQGGTKLGIHKWEKAATFAYITYEDFYIKDKTMPLAIGLRNAYNLADFEILNHTIFKMIAAAMLERTVVMKFGDRSSGGKRIKMGMLYRDHQLYPKSYTI